MSRFSDFPKCARCGHWKIVHRGDRHDGRVTQTPFCGDRVEPLAEGADPPDNSQPVTPHEPRGLREGGQICSWIEYAQMQHAHAHFVSNITMLPRRLSAPACRRRQRPTPYRYTPFHTGGPSDPLSFDQPPSRAACYTRRAHRVILLDSEYGPR